MVESENGKLRACIAERDRLQMFVEDIALYERTKDHRYIQKWSGSMMTEDDIERLRTARPRPTDLERAGAIAGLVLLMLAFVAGGLIGGALVAWVW